MLSRTRRGFTNRTTPTQGLSIAACSAEDCAALNLGYMDPDSVNVDEWRDREDEGVLFVPKAGEMLFRTRPAS